MLLGYRTQHYAGLQITWTVLMCSCLVSAVWTVCNSCHLHSMSGHVVYEMASGKELTSLSPTQQDYQNVPTAFKDVKEFLKFVFQQDDGGKFVQTIEKVNVQLFQL